LSYEVGKEQISGEKSDPSDGLRNKQTVQLVRRLQENKTR